MSDKKIHLGNLRLAAFVSPEAPLAAFIMVVVVFIPPFYAGSMGLGLSVVGLIFGLTKLWDVVTDPLFGFLSDSWHTRWGRRRPWLVASVPLMIICTYQVFSPDPPVTGLYFAVWMIVLYVGWTLASVSHISWAAELSTDYHERSRISAYKQGAGLVGGVALMLMLAMADHIPGFTETHRIELIAKILIIALPLCVLAALWAAPEPYQNTHQPRLKALDKPARVILENGPLRRLLIANLLLGIATGSIGGMFLFLVEDVLLLGDWSSFALLPWFFSGLIFLPLFMKLSNKIGKHKTLCVALIYHIFASLSFLFLPAGDAVLACIALLFLGANQAVGTYIPAAIMADVTDYDAVKTGKQRTGLYMSLLQTSSKVAAALSVGLSYPILSAIGFDASPDAHNSEDVLNGIRWILFALPGGLYLVIIGIMWRFPLDEAKQVILREQLVQMNRAGSPDPV
ncbi:MFS transporter [Maricurvus nonylphenolicus]|uniref:MFS transporter n=1 Tax=Maricurvus nonylphenolicus TaxID=1008307 RepID=UPI0036F43C0C